jgi:hypothetical protein
MQGKFNASNEHHTMTEAIRLSYEKFAKEQIPTQKHLVSG